METVRSEPPYMGSNAHATSPERVPYYSREKRSLKDVPLMPRSMCVRECVGFPAQCPLVSAPLHIY